MGETPSFIGNINKLAEKLDIIMESNDIFDENTLPILEEIAQLDLQEAVKDLAKGNYLGNRKIDINLALNRQGITEDLLKKDPDQAEKIWSNPDKAVLYESCTVTFTDGETLNIPFVYDGNPISISTHGDLLIQLNTNTDFLAKLEGTLVSGFTSPVVGEIIRIYDVIGANSNIERIRLNAVSGAYVTKAPIYYWAKTTSALQTLSMRAGDIIKLSNTIDSIITLSMSIEEVLEIQSHIPQLVDTYTEGKPNGDVTIYNKLSELLEIHAHLSGLLSLYKDIATGGSGYTTAVAKDLQSPDSVIKEVGHNLQTTDTIGDVSSNLDSVNTVANGMDAVKTTADTKEQILTLSEQIAKVEQVASSIKNVDVTAQNIDVITKLADNLSAVGIVATGTAEIHQVASSMPNINTVAKNISSIKVTANSLADIGTVSAGIINVGKVADDMTNVNITAANIDSIKAVNNHTTDITKIVQQVIPNMDEVLMASAHASETATKADEALAYVQELKNLTAVAVQLTSGQSPTAVYNSATGQLTLGIPEGAKGDRGESFSIDARGSIAGRNAYDGASKGFSYLTLDENPTKVYFKASDNPGDWTVGVPFGRGAKGDKGDKGVGIQTITPTSTSNPGGTYHKGGYTDTYTVKFTDGSTSTFDVHNGNGVEKVEFASTTHTSGIAGKSGGKDTYNVVYSDGSTESFVVYNGLDSDVTMDDLTVHTNRKDNPHDVTKAQLRLDNVDNTSDKDKPISDATQTELDSIGTSIRGMNKGLGTINTHLATLDSNIKSINTSLSGVGTDITNLNSAVSSKVTKVTGKGLSTNDFTTALKNKLAGIAAGAQVNSVTSVAGKTGVITLSKSDVGLGNVNNTSDKDKPVSTAVGTALAGKVDKINGKGLSTEDFTTVLLNKLNSIAPNAQVNAVTSVAGRTGAVKVTKADVALEKVLNATQLKKDSNLSDIPNVNIARSNMGLGTTATTNYYVSSGDPTGGNDGDVFYKI